MVTGADSAQQPMAAALVLAFLLPFLRVRSLFKRRFLGKSHSLGAEMSTNAGLSLSPALPPAFSMFLLVCKDPRLWLKGPKTAYT